MSVPMICLRAWLVRYIGRCTSRLQSCAASSSNFGRGESRVSAFVPADPTMTALGAIAFPPTRQDCAIGPLLRATQLP